MARIEKTIFISYRRKDISRALAFISIWPKKYDVFRLHQYPGGFWADNHQQHQARATLFNIDPTALIVVVTRDWLRREIETMEKKRISFHFFWWFYLIALRNGKLTGKLGNINQRAISSGTSRGHGKTTLIFECAIDAVLHPVPWGTESSQREQVAAW
jgi:hypothetical protein